MIAGGPAATNPVPLGAFVDGVFIGEAEGWLARLFTRLAAMKRAGAGPRRAARSRCASDPSVWSPGRTEPVRRAFWRGFGRRPHEPAFPVPSLRMVQDHGTVEIMRGCPNACRFCHAAAFYRPCRQQGPAAIRAEVEPWCAAGYREITLSSLSSGDYPGIHGARARAERRCAPPRKVSFSLPSLRVDSLALGAARGDRRGAQERPDLRRGDPPAGVAARRPKARAAGQDGGNPARGEGARVAAAKFYFMVGLAGLWGRRRGRVPSWSSSAGRARRHRAVPQSTWPPSSPSRTPPTSGPPSSASRKRWTGSGGEEGAAPDGFKVGYHSPFLSLLEGILSRGDERAGSWVRRASGRSPA